ncbi:MAG: hypothetical protein RSB99_03710 [Bacilli bacterium]
MGKITESLSNHVCDKEHLKSEIDLKRKREVIIMKKYTKPALIFGTLAVIVGIIMIPLFFQKDNRTQIAYTKYFSENKKLDNETKSYNAKLKQSFDDYQAGKITMDEYFKEIETIRIAKNSIKAKKAELKAKYAITDDMDLSKVVFSKDKKTDDKLKAIYLKSKTIGDKDEALDLEEEQLEKMYQDGTITKEEFKQKKQSLEAREKAIEKEEEALDAEEEAIDKQAELKEEAEDKKNEEMDANKDKEDEIVDKQEEAKDKEEEAANPKDEAVEDDKEENDKAEPTDIPEKPEVEIPEKPETDGTDI